MLKETGSGVAGGWWRHGSHRLGLLVQRRKPRLELGLQLLLALLERANTLELLGRDQLGRGHAVFTFKCA